MKMKNQLKSGQQITIQNTPIGRRDPRG